MLVIAFDPWQSDNDKATEQITFNQAPPVIRTRPHAVAIFPMEPDVSDVAEQLSMFSSAELRASRLVSPDSGKDWLIRVATSPLRISQFWIDTAPAGAVGRTSPASCQQTTDGRWAPFSEGWGNSVMGSQDECWTLNTSDWPSDGGVCSLSAILETGDVPRRFYLSAKACHGILRRAEKRGKQLPPSLAAALQAVDSGQTSTVTGAA